jgi:hypothetical protein
MKAHFLAYLIVLVLTSVAYSASDYHVLRTIPMTGDGNWDYVSADSVNRRLYVSHGTELDVLNLDSGEIVGKIIPPKIENARTPMLTHGAAVAPDLGLGFTSNGGASSTTIFDLKSLQALAEVKLGGAPDGFLYDPSSKLAFLFSEQTEDATAVDGVHRKVVGTIRLGGKPEEATSDDTGHLYVNIQDKDLVLKLDAKKLAVMESWSVAPLCHEPASMAIDPRNQRIFVGCRNQVMAIVDTSNGHVITTDPIGEVTDAAVFDPQRRLIFSSNMDGTLTVIQEESANKYTVLDNVKTAFGARTMALDLKTHRLFLSLADRRNIPAPGTLSHNLRPEIIPGTFRVLVIGEH